MTAEPRSIRQQPVSAETEAAGRQWMEHWRRGPTRTRWTELPLQVGDEAPSAELVEARTEERRPLASAWADGPAVLLFWRHFGCSCGRDRAARLRDEYGSLRSAGAAVALIGQGEPERTRMYADANQLPPDMPLFCDPEERLYRAFGLLEGDPSQILFDAPDDYLRCERQAGEDLFASRDAAGRPMVDNPWLLPGEFVVAPDGRVALALRFQYCEHWIDPRVTLAAIRRATGELSPAYGIGS